MKKFLLLLILIISIFYMVSCDIDNIELSDNIEAPKNNNLPISGLWRVDDYSLNVTSNIDEEKAQSYIGMEALFNNDFVSIGEDYCIEPSFRIKTVDADEYLIYHYKATPEFLNIDADEIKIISITGAEQFFYEFIMASEDTIIVNMEGVFFYLNKVSETIEFDGAVTKQITENILFDEAEISDEDALRTGILLGLKSLDLENQEQGIEKWNYRTIFIRSHNKEIVSINEMDDILLPRRTGFWKVKMEREEKDGKINDNIVAYPLYKAIDKESEKEIGEETKIEASKEEEKMDSTIKNILYIGNDYISIENIHYRNKGERFLEFYPIDSIGNLKPLMIGDVLGENGKEAFVEGANKEILKEREEYKNSTIDLKPNEESFGLFRRNGHWIFRGRINFVENGIYSYENFNIKAIPPKEIVYYDELIVPWNKIKSKVPEAIDGFTSPSEDLAVILAHNQILVYTIDNGNISSKPVESIRLNPSEKVIMAEWALGRYPKFWENEFSK